MRVCEGEGLALSLYLLVCMAPRSVEAWKNTRKYKTLWKSRNAFTASPQKSQTVPGGRTAAGRWRCMEVLARYLTQGYQQRSEFNQEAEEDPIIRVWVFHRVTVANVDGQDIM